MEQYTTSLENEAGFRVLFECATISILVVGESGNIELANPCAQELFGYSNGELIGQPIELLIPMELRSKHIHHREGYFERPKTRPMGLGMELYARKKDGRVFPVEISLGHYEIAGEKLAVAFVTDITKRKEAEDNLKKINEELEIRVRDRTLELTEALEREKELGELKSRFVSMASHEFRTPLSAVLSSASLIEQYSLPDQEEKRKKHINRIKSSVKNLTGILNDFLSLDKLEQGKVEVEKDVFDLAEFTDDLLEETHTILKTGQHITCTYSGTNEIVQDRKVLRNVLINLLSNASKYSDEGKEIVLDIEVKDNRVRFSVRDKGIGIPEEEQKNLFGKFFRARNALNIQGTGLGLNIVTRYVELLDGTIEFTSKLNEGTTFTVTFPQNKV